MAVLFGSPSRFFGFEMDSFLLSQGSSLHVSKRRKPRHKPLDIILIGPFVIASHVSM
jgi:hypothetical protein